jgi:hypothetical protein
MREMPKSQAAVPACFLSSWSPPTAWARRPHRSLTGPGLIATSRPVYTTTGGNERASGRNVTDLVIPKIGRQPFADGEPSLRLHYKML